MASEIWGPMQLRPNVRFESADAKTGYIWGKPASESAILQGIAADETGFLSAPEVTALGVTATDIVAERWIGADDRTFPSIALTAAGREVPLCELLESAPDAMLGNAHVARFGPFLCTVMKLLDTNQTLDRGGLSVQVHPPDGYVGRPAKPEMWKGRGNLYLGWREDMDEATIRAAVTARNVEKFMNQVSLADDDLVLVPGGLVHAIRANTFTAEWSMAPGQADADGGNDLSRATATLFDGTDGRTPRPGKEDVDSALDIMRAADGFAATTKMTVEPVELSRDASGNVRERLFDTNYVTVEQWRIEGGAFASNFAGRGYGLYVDQGAVELLSGTAAPLRLRAGEEAFVPAAARPLNVRAETSARVQIWYAPL